VSVHRRDTILALTAFGMLGAPTWAFAQPRRRASPARIAILDDAIEAARVQLWDAFRRRLQELGYVEGTDVVFDQRWAGGDAQRLPALAAEMVARQPDVIVAVTTTAALAAKKATAQVPIVAIGPADPVASGLVASLGRPGGNVTGVAPNQAEIAGKWLELVRELVPRAKSVAYLTDRGNPGEMLVSRLLVERARPLRLEVLVLDGVGEGSIEQSFARIGKERADALIVATTASMLGQRQKIVDSAARLRLPAVYARAEYPQAGGLISYGTAADSVFLRAADYVDRILKGARPAEMPFEMASTFQVVVNMSTARTLGIRIPEAIRARAQQIQ
jgi:putative ABC transport system substrate-binding protein